MKRSGNSIADLAARFIDPGLGSPESEELNEAFGADPENRRLFDEFMDVWQASARASQNRDYNEKEAWHKLRNRLRINGENARHSILLKGYRHIWHAAAVVLIFFMLGAGAHLIYHNTNGISTPQTYTEYHVPFGSRSEVTLPDGSTVWLNAGSRLSFDRHFSRKNRDILLEGEAYFDVTKDRIPFYVRVSGATVKVLGTSFNIKAYPDEKIIETTVTRGIVQVCDLPENTTDATRIVLHANQKVSIIKSNIVPSGDAITSIPEHPGAYAAKSTQQSQVQSYKVDRNIATEIYTSWKDERWIIEREELESLAIKLERRYNVEFSFQDEALKHYVFSGVLKDETLEQVMEAIKLTAPIQYQIDQKQVTLSKNTFYKTTQP